MKARLHRLEDRKGCLKDDGILYAIEWTQNNEIRDEYRLQNSPIVHE